MKVMLLTHTADIEEKPLQLTDLPIPVPEKNQILVKISVCGACHTDLDQVEARLASILPAVPGHQIVGTVSDKGADAKKFKTGDRVGITWLYSTCGQCDFCKNDNENLCRHGRYTGKDSHGGYAEYVTIGEDYAYPVPDVFSDSQAAPLLCAGIIGWRAVRLSQISNGQIIGLFGFGASAHIVIQILKFKFPNSPVFVFTRNPDHQEMAVSLGASWAGCPDDKPPEKINRAIDFTPSAKIIQNALSVLDKAGRLVINAIRKEDLVPQLDYTKHLWEEKEIKSVANVTRADAREFLPLAAQIPITAQVEEFGLKDANEVLFKLKHSKLHAAAVLKIQTD